MSSSSEAKKTRRINFLPETKLELTKRAGFHCSFRGCLIHTTGPTQNDEGEDAAAGIAVAAHIYPASVNGPRNQEGISPEKIKDISNGIWLCHTHGTQIDNFQADFPAEVVLEMKAVREYAQKLTLMIPDLGSNIGWIGVKRLDAIVWKHWPNPDEQQIMCEVYAAAAKHLPTAEETFWTKMPVPPSTFDLKPISKASRSVSQIDDAAFLHTHQDSFPAERRRMVQIFAAWTELPRSWGWDGVGHYNNDVYVKISTRNPDTGELDEPFVWARGMASCKHSFNIVDGESITLEFDHTAHQTSNLNWHLNVHIKDGVCRTSSTLSMWKHLNPGRSYESRKREEVEAYIRVLEKLAAGWEPVGFVGLEPGEWSEPDTVHPEAFSIRSEITPEQYAHALQRCSRVKLGYDLADTWGLEFCFNDAFFHKVLDEATIRCASEALLAKLGTGPYPAYAHGDKVVAVNERVSLRLCVKVGQLYFEAVQTAPFIHRGYDSSLRF